MIRALLAVAFGAVAVAPAPPIVQRPIPFDTTRRAETVAYATRHYGLHTWRLTAPHVIVEHYTATTTASSAIATFSSDSPDPELHELPGTCVHFVVDTDGTIYQLVPLDTICRHAVGLNWTAIGIENVGTSDAEILANRRQLRASLALTLWLADRFHIGVRDVVGHAESLTSRYHRERVARLRCQTHSDWQHADMDRYRSLLRALAAQEGVRLGTGSLPVPSPC